MKDFKDLGIEPSSKSLIGNKIPIDNILNKAITVDRFRITPSRYPGKGNGKCLHIQIGIGEFKHVVFTGSVILMDLIERIPESDFPFTAQIVKEGKRYEFTTANKNIIQ
jgi:hypothetical protein